MPAKSPGVCVKVCVEYPIGFPGLSVEFPNSVKQSKTNVVTDALLNVTVFHGHPLGTPLTGTSVICASCVIVAVYLKKLIESVVLVYGGSGSSG
jgi:hypothetical protein